MDQIVGRFALLFAHCPLQYNENDNGRSNHIATMVTSVQISGTVQYVSYWSTSTITVYTTLAICYMLLTLWYQRLMNLHHEFRLSIEEMISCVLKFTTVTMIFKVIWFWLEMSNSRLFGTAATMVILLGATVGYSICK